MAVKPQAPEAGVGAVDRALSVLFAWRPGEDALSLAELSRRTGLYKSTLLRLIASLERARMLLRTSDGACWRLGPALVSLGLMAEAAPFGALRAVVPPALRRLVAETGESASLYVREGETRLCLLREEGRHAVRDQLAAGTLLPLDRGAAARVLRGAAGLSVTLGERDPELAAIAAPLHGPGGALLGALCLSGTVTRLADARRRAPMESAVLREAAVLSAALGATLNPGA
ncbi:IclR family transcriptional regulator [Pseudoroseomonas globiformis]|uniref:IclR family transcriptional regulator n=1 Tax=Teichococcus globiformis TaxID=2307229 RepID=A0ABV7FYZ9_9PROT